MPDERNSPETPDNPQQALDESRHTLTIAGPVPSSGRHQLPLAIGRYRILRLLGEGGMGAVYEAEQEQPRRRVALKVIKAALASPELLRRFELEAQSLGRLHHPGIAQIYEAGRAETAAGVQPFFAMELIQGKPLCGYADEHHLDTRARLALMIRLCEAVEHAHQSGIIHRDLKPANILVDQNGQPKVLDFGVARVTDSDAKATRQTDLGQIIGTLAYMSPEQVLADLLALDTRSDVYALGVILYELLAGKLPYMLNRQLHEAVRTIRETDPAPLSMVSRTYKGDIETIVAKALEKDKSRRYASAAALAEDIRRYLEDEPIAAKPPSTAYQLQKFARRHKALVAGVAAVFVVLVAGIVASSWQAVRANRAGHLALVERDRAVRAERSATDERNKAVSAEQQAVEARNRAISEQQRANNEAATAKAVNDFLQNDVLAQASANAQAGPNTKPDPDLKVRTTLDRAAARIQGKFENQPLVEASIRQTIANTYKNLGLYADAQQHLEHATDLWRRYRGEEQPETLTAMNDLAEVYTDQGKFPLAQALQMKVYETRSRVLGEEHPDTLHSITLLADLYEKQGQYAQAAAMHSKVLQILRRVAGAEQYDTISAMIGLALDYVRFGEFAQAEKLDREAVPLMRRVLGPEHPDTLLGMNNLAQVLYREGKYNEAESIQSDVLNVRRRLLGEEHSDTLTSMNNLGVIYESQRKFSEAEALLAKGWAISRRALGEEHPSTLLLMTNLALIYSGEQKYDQSEAIYTKVIEIRRRVLGPRHPLTTDTMAALSALQMKEGRYQDAEEQARETLKIIEETSPNDWKTYQVRALVGGALSQQKRYAEAEPLLLAGYEGMVQRKAEIPFRNLAYLSQSGEWIVQLYRAWERPDKAAEWQARFEKDSSNAVTSELK
jgi:eukaryotic-like serine/threonine-protein kinase